jgi:hypothetical protein
VASGLLAEFGAEAANQFRRKFGNVHAFRDEEFAAEDGAGLVIVGKLAVYATVLTLLVPTEPAVRNRLGTNELERAKERIPFRHEKGLTENRDLNELFIWTKDFRHKYRFTL